MSSKPRRLRPTRARAVQDHRPTAGYTVVEVLVGLTVATLALLGLTGAMTAGSKLQVQTADYALANRALRFVHERMHTGSLDQRFAEFEAEPSFEIDRVQVEVSFPEQVLVDAIGGPVPADWRYRDGDGDGHVELNVASAARASLVPVSVTLVWNGGEMRSSFMVTER